MNLVKVIFDKNVGMCAEILVREQLTPEQAMTELKAAKYPAYIYSPELVNTDAYFLMEVKNNACKKEYAKQAD